MPNLTKRASNNPAGRPLSPTVTSAVERATLEILVESGYGSLSMDAVAKRAGVSRPALYRRFPDITSLVLAALEQAGQEAANFTPTQGELTEALEQYLLAVANVLDRSTTVGRAFRGALSEALIDDDYAPRFSAFIVRRRAPVEARLRKAYPRMPEQVVEQALDLLFGPLLYRLMIRDVPVSADQIRAFVESALVVMQPYSDANS